MNSLRFRSTGKGDPDKSLLSDEQIKEAIEKGKDKK